MGDERVQLQDMVNDLIVVDFYAENLPDQIRGWKKRTLAPHAQNCRRNLFYGYAEDFEDFPFEHLNRDYTKRGGVDAYAHILKFACGFERGQYNGHNRCQFFEGWADSTKESPETGEKYARLVNRIDSDTKFMHKHIYSHHSPHSHEAVARDLSGMKKGDEVLIIGHVSQNKDKEYELSTFTLAMLKAAEGKQPRRKSFISVTHPDPEVLDIIKTEITKFETRGKKSAIRSGISYIDFEDIPVALELSDQVYVTLPMGLYGEADQLLVQSWQNRVNKDSILTHMQSDWQNKGQLSPTWSKAGLDNFITVKNIREEMADRGCVNAEVITKMERAIWSCSKLRASGKPLMKDSFFGDNPDLVIG